MLDIEAYFHRIGWSGARAPNLEGLTGLCLRHTASVTFENLDILLGRPFVCDVGFGFTPTAPLRLEP